MTNNENNGKITVDIHGETDYTQFSYENSKLKALKKPGENLALLGAKLGTLLDGDPVKELAPEKKAEVSELLARYVANLKAYETMLSEGYNTIVITTLRIKNGTSTGYATRVAGTLKEDLNEAVVFINGMPVPIGAPYILLLHLLKRSSHLYTDPYDKKSIFHDLKRQSKALDGKIEFRTHADPSLQ